MELQFWIDYVFHAREHYRQVGTCKNKSDPMRGTLNACFRRIDGAVSEAIERGFVYCTCRSARDRVLLVFRKGDAQFRRTITHISQFTRDGASLPASERVGVIVAIYNMIFWEGKVLPDPREKWMPTGRKAQQHGRAAADLTARPDT